MGKIKWHWGTGIALAYTVFVGVFVFLVIKSTTFDNSLVVDDYYAKDITYQEHYDRLANSMALEQDLSMKLTQPNLHLSFPENLGPVKGNILFFSPSKSHLDFNLEVDLDDAFQQSISVNELHDGIWWVKVEWEAGGKGYYQEKQFYF